MNCKIFETLKESENDGHTHYDTAWVFKDISLSVFGEKVEFKINLGEKKNLFETENGQRKIEFHF